MLIIHFDAGLELSGTVVKGDTFKERLTILFIVSLALSIFADISIWWEEDQFVNMIL